MSISIYICLSNEILNIYNQRGRGVKVHMSSGFGSEAGSNCGTKYDIERGVSMSIIATRLLLPTGHFPYTVAYYAAFVSTSSF